MVLRDKSLLLGSAAMAAFRAMGDPSSYVASLGKNPYEWQRDVLSPDGKRILILAARQSGKSLIVAGRAVHTAKNKRGALVIIIAPIEKQAKETALKIKEFIREDPELHMVRSNDTEIVLSNGSRIINVTATENGPRGYSGPDLIIFDEASRVPDAVYFATRPQLTTNPDATLIILSTPYGKQGFFWRAWAEETYWKKIRVEVPYELRRTPTGLVVAERSVCLEDYQAYWKERNVNAYLSPQHKLGHLQEELETVGEWWWKQEYGIDFVESQERLFEFEDIMAAFNSDVSPIIQGTEEEYVSDVEALTF